MIFSNCKTNHFLFPMLVQKHRSVSAPLSRFGLEAVDYLKMVGWEAVVILAFGRV